MNRSLLLLALAGASLAAAATDAEDLQWRRRALRAPSPRGYLVVATLSVQGAGPARAALVCENEGVELRAEQGRWTVAVHGKAAASGRLGRTAPASFFVKRTPAAVMVGLNARWLYARPAGPPEGRAAVRVGASAGLTIERFRLVAREPVRFAEDFPDPEPTNGQWAPVRGHWALSSLSSPEHSANPAELAAIFDPIEDEASRGRTRQRYVGVGLMLRGGYPPTVLRLAGDSPAERAGLRVGERVREINGYQPRSATEANALLRGEEGKPVVLKVFGADGKDRTVTLKRELVVWGRSRRQAPLPPVRKGPVALITAGFDFWTDYRFACATRTRGVGACGLVFAYLGPNDYHVFRWIGADKVSEGFGRWQLERVRGGRRNVLASREGGFAPQDYYAMSVTIQGDAPGQIEATCAVDATTVLTAHDDAIVPGQLGFWAEEPGAVSFDDIVVRGNELPPLEPKEGTRNARQRYDQHMKAWGNPAYAWQYDGISTQWWHRADFPGDVTLESPVGGLSKFRLVVSAARGEPDSGYSFELDPATRRATLARAGKTLAAKIVPGHLAKEATLARKGSRVEVRLDGKRWDAFDDPTPLSGSAVLVAGVPLESFRPSAKVHAHCPNVVEYYFNRAPTEWHIMHGSWEVMNRWICDPRWSFFGGRSDGTMAIWNKRPLHGDCYADLYVGPMMFERSGSYENLRDIALTICGDGKNLDSGYSLILGANGNRLTALLRKGQIVASRQDRGALIPSRGWSMQRTLYPSQHRGWIHLKLTREGHVVRGYLFGHLILSFKDTDPLPAGHAAVWTINNGLLLAKVRLAATRVGKPRPLAFLRACRRFADGVLTNDCEDSQANILRNGPAYEITNTTGGGPFAVAFRPRVFSAAERRRLSFDIKLTPEAHVDLYLSCRGSLYRVRLSGPAATPSGIVSLGAAEGVQPDGKWHRVSVGLYDALRKLHPDDPLLMVWRPMLANFSADDYLLAGFGGNGAGARYWLRNVALTRTDAHTHASHRPAPQ